MACIMIFASRASPINKNRRCIDIRMNPLAGMIMRIAYSRPRPNVALKLYCRRPLNYRYGYEPAQ